MRARRFVPLFVAVGCLEVGALAPTAGCNGTGATPVCDFPDGANNPEAGCGVLIEASPGEGSVDAAEEPTPVVDSGVDATKDATSSVLPDSAIVDSSAGDAPPDAPPADAPTESDAGDASDDSPG